MDLGEKAKLTAANSLREEGDSGVRVSEDKEGVHSPLLPCVPFRRSERTTEV